MTDVQGIVSTTSSGVAILVGIGAVLDRWVRRNDHPPGPQLASPAGLIVLSRPRFSSSQAPRRGRRAASPPFRRAVKVLRVCLVLAAWLVCFAAGNNIFALAVSLLAETSDTLHRIAAGQEMLGSFGVGDVLSVVIVTNVSSLFIAESSGWKREGAVVATAMGFALPSIVFTALVVRDRL